MRKMKDSGVDWIGKIPDSWDISTINSLYTLRNQKVSDRDYPPLSVTMKGIVPQLETAAKTDAHDDRKHVKKGDFAINSRSDRRGSCGISDYDGSVSLINTVLTPRGEMHPVYYNWLFHSSSFADEFYRWGHGIVDDLWTTRWQEMRNITIPIPEYDEQQKIADHLDRKCSQIDALIANVEHQIEKLKAYKQSIITETVTKGLDPDVPMKDSGVEWIGEIPEHWRLLKAFFVYDKIGDIDHYMPESIQDGIPYVMTGDLKSNASEINFEMCKQVSKLDYDSLSKKINVNIGDVIFARYATIGTVCYVDINKEFLVSYSCLIIKPNELINGRFLYYYYKSHSFFEEIKRVINSNTQANVGLDAMTKVRIICPILVDQQQIADYLDEKCTQIDRLIVLKQQKIEKLQQYKKSLIYEYVTGKKEV